jgi:hypothetical protein
LNQLDHHTRYNIFSEIVFYFYEIINIVQISSKSVPIYDENLIYKIISIPKKKRNDDSSQSFKASKPPLLSNILQPVLQ